jgi:hypothetical protein
VSPSGFEVLSDCRMLQYWPHIQVYCDVSVRWILTMKCDASDSVKINAQGGLSAANRTTRLYMSSLLSMPAVCRHSNTKLSCSQKL